jgi:hypothetical protein
VGLLKVNDFKRENRKMGIDTQPAASLHGPHLNQGQQPQTGDVASNREYTAKHFGKKLIAILCSVGVRRGVFYRETRRVTLK